MSVKILTPMQPIHVVDGAAFASFATFQDVSPAPALIIPAQDMEVGMELELEFSGEVSATGTPTLQLGFWFNTAATVLAQNAATALVTTAAVWPIQGWWRGRLRAAASGASGGSWNGQGEVKVGGSLTAWQTGFPCPIPTTKALRTVACDVTAARAVGVGAAFGASSASNIVTINMLSATLRTGY
jgi:hypothetical protein